MGSDEEGNVQLLCEHAEDGTLYPEEVSAYIVAELLSAAEEVTESQITKAVISVRELSLHRSLLPRLHRILSTQHISP